MMGEQASTQKKKKMLAGIIVLACICLGSGAGVGALYWFLKDDIQRKQEEVFLESLADVLGEAESYLTVIQYADDVPDEARVYVSTADPGILYAAMGAAQGYQSQIKVLVSVRASAPNTPVDDAPVIHRLTVVSSQETPGLGENIKAVEKDVSIWSVMAGAEATPKRPWFQEQFSGKRLSDIMVEKRADTDKIVPVTGATMTSKAVVEAGRNAIGRIIEATAEAYGK